MQRGEFQLALHHTHALEQAIAIPESPVPYREQLCVCWYDFAVIVDKNRCHFFAGLENLECF
jgi:hypothetical protein